MRRRPLPVRTVPSADPAAADDLLTVHVVAGGAEHATVSLVGELDLTNAVLVSDALSEQVGQGRRFVQLELSRLTFVNSAGLRVIALAHNRFVAAGGSLVLSGVGPRIARLLQITRLDTALQIAAPATGRHLVSVSTMTSPRR